MGGPGRALANGALVPLSLFLVFAGAELYFRAVSPQRSDSGRLFAPHPQLGWSFAPDQRSAVVFKGTAARYVRTNAHGFRDASFAPTAVGTHRVAVLGDSFVANLAVADEEVFTEVMERALPGVSVMNLGVNGYGQVQQILLLERALQEFAPRLVVVVIYSRNDFTENTGIDWAPGLARPSAELDPDSRLLLRPPREAARRPVRPAVPLLDRLHLVHFLRDRAAYLRGRRAARPDHRGRFQPSRATPPELYLAAVDPTEETDRLYRLMERLLLELATRSDAMGVPLVFALAPSLAQVVPEVWERILDANRADVAGFDLELPSRRLLAFARQHGLRMLDLLPPLRAAQARGESTYYLVQQHWTPTGNRVVAEALLAFLGADPELRAALAPAG